MGAITGTVAGTTEFAGDYKVLKITVHLPLASDTVTLYGGNAWNFEILYVIPKLTSGYDAAFGWDFCDLFWLGDYSRDD